MLGFAFAIVIVCFMFLGLGRDKITDSSLSAPQRQAARIKENFLKMLSPTTEQLESIQNNKDFSDVVDDVSYILGKQCSLAHVTKLATEICYHVVEGIPSLRWQQAVVMIRLSRIGKIKGGYMETSDTQVRNEKQEEIIKRYLTLLCDNLRANGVKTNVVMRRDYAYKIYNLDQFAETREGLTVIY